MTGRPYSIAQVAVIAVCALMLAGCTASGLGEEPRRTDPTAGGRNGPWAAEFAAALDDDPSSFERDVLADGVVTENEVAEAHSGMRRCMKDAGLTINWFKNGGFEVGGEDGGPPPFARDRTDALLRACERRWDNSITYLFEQTRRNPEKLDDAKITVACLRTSGIVPKSYSERKWRAENDTGDFSFDEWDGRAVQCRLDPLGLWRDG